MSASVSTKNNMSYSGGHQALVNKFLCELCLHPGFDMSSEIERRLTNAFAIHVANKIEYYARVTIETEIEYINNEITSKIVYQDFILLAAPYLDIIKKI